MKPKLTILIACFNDQDFIEVSLYALSKLTKNPYQVYILDNGSKLKNYEKLKRICSKYNNVFLERKETDLRGSLAHGTAFNYLIKKVDTPYFSILDADATWLKKNWDEILINKLKGNIKVIGTQAPINKILQKPLDFPLMFAILFEAKTFKKLNIDFRPKNLVKLQDTGYEIRKKFLGAGYRGANIEIKNTREFHNGPFRKLIVAEYYLNGGEKIFASHFGRGATLGICKYGTGHGVSSIYKIPYVSIPLRYIKGYMEKQKWIKICKKIIDEQI